MIRLPLGSNEQTIRAALNTWVQVLATEGEAAALELLYEQPGVNGWTSELLRGAIQLYDMSDLNEGQTPEIMRVTGVAPDEVIGIRWFEDHNPDQLAWIPVGLMLNQQTSDLAAEFRLLEHDGAWVLMLLECHVL
jgi:hypothetical protein